MTNSPGVTLFSVATAAAREEWEKQAKRRSATGKIFFIERQRALIRPFGPSFSRKEKDPLTCFGQFGTLRGLRLLTVIRAWSRAAEEQSLSIGCVNEVDAAGFVRSVFRLVGVDDDFGSDGQRLLCISKAN